MSSKRHACEGDEARDAFRAALLDVCGSLAMDVVRNGEGVQHVIQVTVQNAPSRDLAVAVGRSIVNSPLFKTAVAGNDPNVGRLLMAVGKAVGSHPDTPEQFINSNALMDTLRVSVGGVDVFADGESKLSEATESVLKQHMQGAQMWSKSPQSQTTICHASNSLRMFSPPQLALHALFAILLRRFHARTHECPYSRQGWPSAGSC